MFDSFFLRDLIIYGALLALTLFITKQHNLWGVKKATSKTKVDVKKAKEEANYRNIILWFLNKAEFICHNFGFEPSLAVVEKYRYNIFRGRLNIPYVDRAITPVELIGIFKVIKFVSCFLAIFLSVLTYLYQSSLSCKITPFFVNFSCNALTSNEEKSSVIAAAVPAA